jgi:hypothetical protein
MYIFVFLWTPVLDTGSTPLGMVFSCFMASIYWPTFSTMKMKYFRRKDTRTFFSKLTITTGVQVFHSFLGGEGGGERNPFGSVWETREIIRHKAGLWIRIRPDPKLFACSDPDP